MKTILTYIAGFVVTGAALLVFVANFSAVETRHRCSGRLSSTDANQPAIVFIRVEEYRWWVGLWGKSDGAVSLEVPNQWVEYYSHVDESGDQLLISDTSGRLGGTYSKLSGSLSLHTTVGNFQGACTTL